MVATTVQSALSGWFQCMRASLLNTRTLIMAALAPGIFHDRHAYIAISLCIFMLPLYCLCAFDWGETTVHLNYTRALRIGEAGRSTLKRRISRHQTNALFTTGQGALTTLFLLTTGLLSFTYYIYFVKFLAFVLSNPKELLTLLFATLVAIFKFWFYSRIVDSIYKYPKQSFAVFALLSKQGGFANFDYNFTIAKPILVIFVLCTTEIVPFKLLGGMLICLDKLALLVLNIPYHLYQMILILDSEMEHVAFQAKSTSGMFTSKKWLVTLIGALHPAYYSFQVQDPPPNMPTRPAIPAPGLGGERWYQGVTAKQWDTCKRVLPKLLGNQISKFSGVASEFKDFNYAVRMATRQYGELFSIMTGQNPKPDPTNPNNVNHPSSDGLAVGETLTPRKQLEMYYEIQQMGHAWAYLSIDDNEAAGRQLKTEVGAENEKDIENADEGEIDESTRTWTRLSNFQRTGGLAVTESLKRKLNEVLWFKIDKIGASEWHTQVRQRYGELHRHDVDAETMDHIVDTLIERTYRPKDQDKYYSLYGPVLTVTIARFKEDMRKRVDDHRVDQNNAKNSFHFDEYFKHLNQIATLYDFSDKKWTRDSLESDAKIDDELDAQEYDEVEDEDYEVEDGVEDGVEDESNEPHWSGLSAKRKDEHDQTDRHVAQKREDHAPRWIVDSDRESGGEVVCYFANGTSSRLSITDRRYQGYRRSRGQAYYAGKGGQGKGGKGRGYGAKGGKKIIECYRCRDEGFPGRNHYSNDPTCPFYNDNEDRAAALNAMIDERIKAGTAAAALGNEARPQVDAPMRNPHPFFGMNLAMRAPNSEC